VTGEAAAPGEELDVRRATAGGRRTESFRGATWVVRPVSGPRAVKAYRCPGCDQEIRSGVPHVVVWPFDGPAAFGDGVGDRRHWHTPCWSARERRGRRG
jgi:hypothetical protein